MGQVRGPASPRLSRHSPGVDAGGQCSVRPCGSLALGKVRLTSEGSRGSLGVTTGDREGLVCH